MDGHYPWPRERDLPDLDAIGIRGNLGNARRVFAADLNSPVRKGVDARPPSGADGQVTHSSADRDGWPLRIGEDGTDRAGLSTTSGGHSGDREDRGRALVSEGPSPDVVTLPGRGRGHLNWRVAAAVCFGVVNLAVAIALLFPLIRAGAPLRAVDFHIFYAAGWAVAHGLDPYSGGPLARAAIAASGAGLAHPFGAFPYLPWVGWVVAPWSLLPYAIALPIWIAMSIALVGGAAWAWLRALPRQGSWPVALLIAVSPVALLGYQVGQLDAVLVALVVGVLLAAGGERWIAAGLLSAAAALLKPQVVLPLVPLLLLFAARERGPVRRVLMGQLVSLAVLVGVPALLQPGRLAAWSLALMTFSHGVAQPQASLVGFAAVLRLFVGSGRIAFGIGSIPTLLLMAVGTGVLAWLLGMPRDDGWRRVSLTERAGWELLLPLAIWVLVSPYVHPYDTLVLMPLVLLALGTHRREPLRPRDWLLAFAVTVLPVAFLVSSDALAGTAGPLSTLAVLLLLVFAVERRRRLGPQLAVLRADRAGEERRFRRRDSQRRQKTARRSPSSSWWDSKS